MQKCILSPSMTRSATFQQNTMRPTLSNSASGPYWAREVFQLLHPPKIFALMITISACIFCLCRGLGLLPMHLPVGQIALPLITNNNWLCNLGIRVSILSHISKPSKDTLPPNLGSCPPSRQLIVRNALN